MYIRINVSKIFLVAYKQKMLVPIFLKCNKMNNDTNTPTVHVNHHPKRKILPLTKPMFRLFLRLPCKMSMYLKCLLSRQNTRYHFLDNNYERKSLSQVIYRKTNIPMFHLRPPVVTVTSPLIGISEHHRCFFTKSWGTLMECLPGFNSQVKELPLNK